MLLYDGLGQHEGQKYAFICHTVPGRLSADQAWRKPEGCTTAP